MKYITACNTKFSSGPKNAIIPPAMPGPIIRIELKAIEFSAMAFISLSRGTEFATSVCRSGFISPQPAPVRNENRVEVPYLRQVEHEQPRERERQQREVRLVDEQHLAPVGETGPR